MDRESKFYILRGIVMGSFLDDEQKKEMIEFVNQLESEDDINFLESH